MTNIYKTRLLTPDKLILKFGVILIPAVLFFSSCSVTKPSYYFKNVTKDTIFTHPASTDVELKIKKADLISIGISSLSRDEDVLFNTGGIGKDPLTGYEVSPEGNIYLHKVGKVAVEGMTRRELKNRLEKELQPFLKDPIVSVSFLNHHITVLGEVGLTQVIDMPAERISLIEALAKSGGVNEAGKKTELLVIRETPTTKQFKHVNLEDQSVFTSSWYYLQPNDIVVVNPDLDKLKKAEKSGRNQQILTNVLSSVSIAFIILDKITR